MGDCTGRTFLVTGANTGIGRITAEDLARRGGEVFLTARDQSKAQPVLDAIAAGGGRATFLAMDLADLASVKSCAEAFLATNHTLDVMILNAGLAGTHGQTKQGFELAFGVNHLGHFLLTKLLLAKLEQSAHPRVVVVASKAHYDSKKPFDYSSLQTPTHTRYGLPEYAVSKLANVMFAKELTRRHPKVRSYSLHPGVIASDVWRHAPWIVRKLATLFMISVEEGARTSLYCATSPDVAEVTGKYYDSCEERTPNPRADDETAAKELWDKSAEWVAAYT